MNDEKNLLNNRLEQEIDFGTLFFKYIYCWKWFVLSVLISSFLAFLYLRIQTPVYEISSKVLIKEDEKKATKSNNPLSSIQDLGMLSMTSNFDNELEILRSRTLVKKVVNDLGLYIDVNLPQSLCYDLPIYKDSPLKIYMSPQEADNLNAPIRLVLEYHQEGDLHILAEYKNNNQKKKIEKSFTKLPAVLPTPVGVITVSLTDSLALNQTFMLKAMIKNPTATAINYLNELTVFPTSKTTTIAKICIKNTVKLRGEDFINSLIKNYNCDANDEKNEVAQKTAEFIQERIRIINGELGLTEKKMADFKQKSGLTNLTSDAQMALQESSKYEQQRTENATQIRLVQYLNNYINDPTNKNEVIPANVGLKDPSLTSVIDQYNTMIIERKRLLRTSSENNPAVIHINTGIEAMRHNVRTTVNSVLRGLQITETDISRQASKFEARISNAPKQEKEFMSISRQQEIQAALYIMLLEKREENAITLASTANNGRIIESPMASITPVYPKKLVIMFVAIIIGLTLPIGGIFIYDFTRYKIEGCEDVKAITALPIIGEIPQSNIQAVEGAIMVRENSNELMEEAFRSFRTNTLFMLEKHEKVILFTSSIPGEGKSFVAGNLATSMAFLGKKVLVIGMDIRKPGLNKVFNLSRHAKGITDYLVDPEHQDLFKLIQHSDISDNLDVLVGGTIPPNPTELVARDVLDKAINQLKERYDYLLLDTAPIAMVTDTSIISRVSDMCVYVGRVGVTPKVEFNFINQLNNNKQIKKLAVVLNGVSLNRGKYGYNYRYGGYRSSRYGYGYGYDKINQ